VSFFLGVEYVHFATLKFTGPPVIILKPFNLSLSHTFCDRRSVGLPRHHHHWHVLIPQRFHVKGARPEGGGEKDGGRGRRRGGGGREREGGDIIEGEEGKKGRREEEKQHGKEDGATQTG
jgi:hypothetical protein